MRVDWPHEFPGAYWREQKEQVVLHHHVSLFRCYGLGKAKYVDAYKAAAMKATMQ